jgi:hypothetical protein
MAASTTQGRVARTELDRIMRSYAFLERISSKMYEKGIKFNHLKIGCDVSEKIIKKSCVQICACGHVHDNLHIRELASSVRVLHTCTHLVIKSARRSKWPRACTQSYSVQLFERKTNSGAKIIDPQNKHQHRSPNLEKISKPDPTSMMNHHDDDDAIIQRPDPKTINVRLQLHNDLDVL